MGDGQLPCKQKGMAYMEDLRVALLGLYCTFMDDLLQKKTQQFE